MEPNGNKIKVLYLIDSLGRGGAELLLIKILKYLDPQKYTTIVAHLYPNDELKSFLEKNDVRVYNLGLKNRSHFLRGFLSLRKILKKEKVNLIHTHLYDATILGRLVARSCGIKNIFTTLHYQTGSLQGQYHIFNYIKKWADKKTARWNKACIAVSHVVKKEFQQLLSFENIQVIHNGIDPSDFHILDSLSKETARQHLGFNNKDFIFLSMGRLHPEKGHIYLLKAFKEIHKKYPYIILLIVGEGRELNYLSNTANTMKLLNKRIFFLNKQKNISYLLKASDAFILPSLYEGFGMSALEAMYAKLPVIASDVGGLLDIIEHGKDGLLVPKANSTLLASAMTQMIENPGLYTQLSNAGHQKVNSHFLIQNCISKLDQLYQSIQ